MKTNLIKGGGWFGYPQRTAYRHFYLPGGRFSVVGFRLVEKPSRTDSMLRGGSWFNIDRNCRLSNRYWNVTEGRDSYDGFRLVEEKQKT